MNRGVMMGVGITAVALCLFNSLLSALAIFVLGPYAVARTGTTIMLELLLWIPACAALKWPRTGFVMFVVFLTLCALTFRMPSQLKVSPMTIWVNFAYNLRFSLAGGALLLLNVVMEAVGTSHAPAE